MDDLHMIKHDYNIALFIVFIPFILCETPSNLILKRITPRLWLSFLLFGCGLMAILQGVVESFGALVACRFFLGIFEAGVSPGSILLITMYYRREELPRRICWWYMSGTIAGAFGGLLAYALANMSVMVPLSCTDADHNQERGPRVWWMEMVSGKNPRTLE